LISIILDVYRFAKPKNSSNSSRHTVLTEELTRLGEVVGEVEHTQFVALLSDEEIVMMAEPGEHRC
jgi:hypothetical protein